MSHQSNLAGEDRSLAARTGYWGRWVILGFLMALCFISHFNRASMASAGDERIMKQFDIAPKDMGLLYSGFLLVYTVFMIPGGWLIDRRGPRFALTCMGLGSALFCALTGGIGFGVFAGDQVWWALLLVRSLMGLLSATLHPGAARAVGNWFPPGQQATANGMITGACLLAYAAVHPVFGSLIDRFDWPVAFVITGAITALLAVAWRVFATDTPGAEGGVPTLVSPVRSSAQPEPESRASELGGTASGRRSLVFLTLSYSAVGYFQYLFFYWLDYYFRSVLHMSPQESRFFAGLPSLVMAVCMPFGGWLTDCAARWRGESSGRTLVPKFGMIVSALLLVCAIFARDRREIIFFFAASFGVLGLCEASFWTVAVNLFPGRGGMSAAIMNTGGNALGLLAPTVTPWLGTQLGWAWGLGAGALIGALGGLCWFGIVPRERNSDRDESGVPESANPAFDAGT